MVPNSRPFLWISFVFTILIRATVFQLVTDIPASKLAKMADQGLSQLFESGAFSCLKHFLFEFDSFGIYLWYLALALQVLSSARSFISWREYDSQQQCKHEGNTLLEGIKELEDRLSNRKLDPSIEREKMKVDAYVRDASWRETQTLVLS